jgi:hypothetical protein
LFIIHDYCTEGPSPAPDQIHQIDPLPRGARLPVFARMASVLWRIIAELNRRPLRRTLSLFDQKDNSRARGRVKTERLFQPRFARNCLFQQPLWYVKPVEGVAENDQGSDCSKWSRRCARKTVRDFLELNVEQRLSLCRCLHLGREHAALSHRCYLWSGGDGTSMPRCKPPLLVNIAHIPKVNDLRGRPACARRSSARTVSASGAVDARHYGAIEGHHEAALGGDVAPLRFR